MRHGEGLAVMTQWNKGAPGVVLFKDGAFNRRLRIPLIGA